MVCFEFKGGIGTASRKLHERQGGYTVGALVQANFGLRHQLLIAGAPVGRELSEGAFRQRENGSIIIVVATDAPLMPHQLKRLARRAAMGLARTGSVAGNSSGDIFIAFSTANPNAAPIGRDGPARNAAERPDESFVRSDRAVSRGSDHQRDGRRRDDGRSRRSQSRRAAARPCARGFEEIQPVDRTEEVTDGNAGGKYLFRLRPFRVVLQ